MKTLHGGSRSTSGMESSSTEEASAPNSHYRTIISDYCTNDLSDGHFNHKPLWSDLESPSILQLKGFGLTQLIAQTLLLRQNLLLACNGRLHSKILDKPESNMNEQRISYMKEGLETFEKVVDGIFPCLLAIQEDGASTLPTDDKDTSVPSNQNQKSRGRNSLSEPPEANEVCLLKGCDNDLINNTTVHHKTVETEPSTLVPITEETTKLQILHHSSQVPKPTTDDVVDVRFIMLSLKTNRSK
ncbi:hypothetical protein O6H91_12G046300 [Diphasiastrum complanatum]|uniref:Uncharacterized protein n=1 Tax=Diphasiastrum complanatum TaxID=34168 RepID=A0ACC2C197_DIPCM|nr:hypothetical protein O6H91_12G046300 [Diphasiastrum complanatum]